MMYNEKIQRFFFAPKHVGVIDTKHPLSAVVKNSLKNQGTIEFYIQYNHEGTLVRACFKTNSDPYVIASLEWLCRELEGKNVGNMPQIDSTALMKNLDIPSTEYPMVLRIITIYKELIQIIKKDKSN